MLQEVLRANIEAKLNNNTQVEEFIVGQYAKTDASDDEFIYNVKNGYRLIEKTYIPTMMVFSAEYKAIPDSITGFATITLNFLVGDDDDRTDKLNAMEEIITKIVANNESVGDGSTTYNTIWNMDAITPSGLILANGRYFIQLNTTIYIEFSNTFYFGNQWSFYLESVRIYPYSASTERKIELASPHILGEKEATSLSETAIWSGTHAFWVNSALSTLIDTLNSTYDMSIIRTLKIVSPTNSTGITLNVIVDGSKANYDLGEKATLTLTFVKSYSE